MLMALPVLIHVFIFSYLPMGGIILPFINYKPVLGFFKSPWIGLKNFKYFFSTPDLWWALTSKTLKMNAMFIIVGLIASVVLALLLNEVKKKIYVKVYQTSIFFPYFLSWVVVSFMLFSFLSFDHGVINTIVEKLGGQAVNWYSDPKYWTEILLISSVWKGAGVGCVIYYATLMGVDKEYYEAAAIDGASKFQMATQISIPFLIPIITINLLLSIGSIIRADFGMFYFLPRDVGVLYPVTDVIDTYVYRALRATNSTGLSSAVGLYQSFIGFVLVMVSNGLVKIFNKENSLF
jgi:putative aldouronate transport system permease protein